eukprot:jgi/Bigna1/72376/fgenesh1_pg.19_\
MSFRPTLSRVSTIAEATKEALTASRTLDQRKQDRTKWCKKIFSYLDEDGDSHLTRGELFRWFAQVLLGRALRSIHRVNGNGISTISKKKDKPISKLMKILEHHDVGMMKLNASDYAHMWHDLLGRVYLKICAELNVNQLYNLDVQLNNSQMVVLSFLRSFTDEITNRWGIVESDLLAELLTDEDRKQLRKPVSMTEFAHKIGKLAADSLEHTMFLLGKILRFIGVCLTDTSLLQHIHLDIKKYLLSIYKEREFNPTPPEEGKHLGLAYKQWVKERKTMTGSLPKQEKLDHDTEDAMKGYIQVILEHLDDNGDGYLSTAEFAGESVHAVARNCLCYHEIIFCLAVLYWKKIGSFLNRLPMDLLSSEFYGKLFKDADADEGGALEMEEFVHFMEVVIYSQGTFSIPHLMDTPTQIIGQVFTTIDTTGQGSLSLSEMYQTQKLLTGQRASVQEIGTAVDGLDMETKVTNTEFIDFVLAAFVKSVKLERNIAIPHFFCMAVLLCKEDAVLKAMQREKKKKQLKRLRSMQMSSKRRAKSQISSAMKMDLGFLISSETLDVAAMRESVDTRYASQVKLVHTCSSYGLPLSAAEGFMSEYSQYGRKNKNGLYHVQDFLDEFVRVKIFQMMEKMAQTQLNNVAMTLDDLLEVLSSIVGETEAKKHFKLLFRNTDTKLDGFLDKNEIKQWYNEKEKQRVAFQQMRIARKASTKRSKKKSNKLSKAVFFGTFSI